MACHWNILEKYMTYASKFLSMTWALFFYRAKDVSSVTLANTQQILE
jgi:hypothetical protein